MTARFFAAWPLLLASLGCAARHVPLAPAPGAEPAPNVTTEQEPPALPGAASRVAAGPASPPAGPLPGGNEPTPERALPELRLEALGMHVGGGTNSPEEKAPFHRALERQFSDFLACYRLVDDPWAGGSFGVDLKIARAGGAPKVEQPRTRIRGAGFQECMVTAFGNVQFEKPKAGPTVVSYSLRFALGTKAKR